ncbi:MAG: EamA family transporter [Treponema sp.]|nr:EamA family transporter [Treponema sp.]MEE3435025.1 EamA family transporter [Treponema sp.]
MILYVAFLLFSNFVGAVSQVLLKKSALELHKSVVREYLNAKVVIAYALFFAAVFIDLTALKIVPASYVPIIEASSYVFAIILSRVFFNDRIKAKQVAAIALIIAGIAVYVL